MHKKKSKKGEKVKNLHELCDKICLEEGTYLIMTGLDSSSLPFSPSLYLFISE